MSTAKRRLKPIEITLLVVPLGALIFASWRMYSRPTPSKMFVPPHYKVTDLGSIGSGVRITGMNDKGEIVGAWGASNKTWRPVIWRGGKMYFLSQQVGIAEAINSKGSIVLNIGSNISVGSAFLLKNGKMRKLGTLGGIYSYAADINDKEEIVGFADGKNQNGTRNSHGFLWRSGVMQDISGDDNEFQTPRSINEQGEVVGVSHHMQACLWQQGYFTVLEDGTDARRINNKSQVLGYSNTVATTEVSIWEGSRRKPLQSNKGVKVNFVGSISNQGLIVGAAQRQIAKPFRVFAFIYANNQVHDLNSLIDPSGWYLRLAYAINNHGQIVGEGTLNGQRRFFLLTPKTPVASATSSTR